jgi:hypothetical protein
MKKRKIITKAERKAAQEKEMQRFLKRMGYGGSGPAESIHEIPCYKVKSVYKTSDQIPGNGPKFQHNIYSGDQLIGISQLHKSNAVPIRKDNKQAVIDAAQMRRN